MYNKNGFEKVKKWNANKNKRDRNSLYSIWKS